MTKRSKVAMCVYCGEKRNVTRDHVISKCLFPDNYTKKKPVIVPSCEPCQQSFSLDEEYFRQFITMPAVDQSKDAAELFGSKIRRSIEYRPAIGHGWLKKMEEVQLYSKDGRYLGAKTSVETPNSDWKRYHRVLDKFIRGLFFHEVGKILPPKVRIQHLWGWKNIEKFHSYIQTWNLDNQEICAYGFAFAPGTYTSLWAMVFFETCSFLSFTNPKQ